MNLTLSSDQIRTMATFYTCAGACNLVNLTDFLLAIEKTEYHNMSEEIKVPKLKPVTAGPCNPTDMPIMDSHVEEIIIPSKKIFSEAQMLSSDKFRMEHEILKFLQFEFMKMLSKKKPDYFPKDGKLSMDMIQEMAEMYAKEFGGDPMMGIEMFVNEYQRFFSIASPRDFKFAFGRSFLSADTRGALYTTAEQRWILAPFGESTYKKEAASMQRYTR